MAPAGCARIECSRGFSLLEVLVAISIMVVAATALANLSAMSTRANISAKTATLTALLAAQKLEQLRALTWGFDAAGALVSDTTTDITVFPPEPQDGVGLTPSPASALRENISGYYDVLDASGAPLRGSARTTARFVRRWSIEPLPSDPGSTLVLQVLVTRAGDAMAGMVRLRPDEARIITVKTRKGS